MKAVEQPLKLAEFVTLLALMTSIMALSTDAMLPALGVIADELSLANPNDAQLVVSAMFFGFAFGQMAAGPLSDSFGRKPVIYAGYIIFIFGCLLSSYAQDFDTMLIGRVFQGLGAAAPRIVGMALVRDGYSGRQMAKIMSIVMAIFVLVPAIAPALGEVVIYFSGWRAIFDLLLIAGVIAFCWFALRQPETLAVTNRRKFDLTNIVQAFGEVLRNKITAGYTVTSGIIFGAFIGYLNSAQQIFQDTYGTGKWFAVYFGIGALSVGLAGIFNSRMVVKFGMRYMTWRATIALTGFSFALALATIIWNGIPPLWMFMAWILFAFFCVGILLGNLNSMAMEPMGKMAGIAAAVFGSFSTFISMPVGLIIGAYYDGTLFPLMIGFSISGILAIMTMWWTNQAAIKAEG